MVHFWEEKKKNPDEEISKYCSKVAFVYVAKKKNQF